MIRPDNFVKINTLSAMPPETGKEKKKKSHKHNKQKPDVQLNGDASESELAKKPKKRKIQDNQSPSKNTLKSNVVQVIAEPGQLLPRPSIFKRSNREQLANTVPSSSFIKKINFENFNLETFNSERFTNSLNLNEGSKKITPPEENGLPKNRVENTIVIDDNSDQMETIVIDDEKNHPLKSTNSTPVEKSSPEVVNENQDTSSSSAVKDKSQIGVRKMREAVIRAYQVPHQNAFIVHIQDPSEFSFIGKMRLTLLVGCLQVFGTYLEPDESHDLYFPKFCTTPVIRMAMPSGELEIEELETFLLNKNLITKSNMKKLLNEIKPMDSVAFIEDSPCNFVKVFEKYWDKQLFSDFPPMTALPEISHCFFNLRNSNSIKEFRNNPAWDELHLGGCNFICGGKNVGKSSLLKYLINTRISETQNAVVCLDLDPGQPEFCPPGCLAITILRKKVFGPNFVQVVEPEKMVFYGEVSVAQQPITYLEAVQFIVDYYRNDPVLSDMPCFVNTMGFCKGLGVDLTVSVIKLLRPDTIIQITSTDNKNNFPYHFTPERLKSSESHIFNIPDTSDFSYEFNLLESYSEEDGVQLLGGLKPRDLRDLKLLSYFSQMVTPEKPDFNSVQPYSIHFSKLHLAVQGAITPNEILKAFNGNMVGLCEYKEDRTCEVLESVESDYFKILMKPKTMPCLALGFVRGIDVTSKTIYVITHLSSAIMETVNCLTLGFLTPPHSIYLKQDTVEGPIPYTSINSGDNVQMVKRAYRFPRNQTA